MKKVGTGTKTPCGGEVTVEVIVWLVRGVVDDGFELEFQLNLWEENKNLRIAPGGLWVHCDFIASAAGHPFGALCSIHRS